MFFPLVVWPILPFTIPFYLVLLVMDASGTGIFNIHYYQFLTVHSFDNEFMHSFSYSSHTHTHAITILNRATPGPPIRRILAPASTSAVAAHEGGPTADRVDRASPPGRKRGHLRRRHHGATS